MKKSECIPQFPELLPLVTLFYNQPNTVHYKWNDGSWCRLLVEEGTSQGCQLSPLFASFVVARLLEPIDGLLRERAAARLANGDTGDDGQGGIQQAHWILKERAKGGERKAIDMTPSDTAFSKSAGSHHLFSRYKLFECLIDVNQVSRDAFAAAEYATAGTAASLSEAMILRTRKQVTKKMVDLAATPRTKKKVMVVRTALSRRNVTSGPNANKTRPHLRLFLHIKPLSNT